jgi:hypothetical protein
MDRMPKRNVALLNAFKEGKKEKARRKKKKNTTHTFRRKRISGPAQRVEEAAEDPAVGCDGYDGGCVN